jgi:hypothetical protein
MFCMESARRSINHSTVYNGDMSSHSDFKLKLRVSRPLGGQISSRFHLTIKVTRHWCQALPPGTSGGGGGGGGGRGGGGGGGGVTGGGCQRAELRQFLVIGLRKTLATSSSHPLYFMDASVGLLGSLLCFRYDIVFDRHTCNEKAGDIYKTLVSWSIPISTRRSLHRAPMLWWQHRMGIQRAPAFPR